MIEISGILWLNLGCFIAGVLIGMVSAAGIIGLVKIFSDDKEDKQQ